MEGPDLETDCPHAGHHAIATAGVRDTGITHSMKELLNMNIAGVKFTLSGDSSVNLHKPDPAYEFFLNRVSGLTGSENIDVRLNTDKSMPHTHGCKLIFESAQSWSLYRDDKFYIIVLSPPDLDQPLWLARVNSDFTGAIVYLSDQFITEENHRTCIVNPLEYPLDQILLMHFLAQRQGLIVHAMGLGRNGMGFIFPGISGAGKSTLAKRLLTFENLELLSDDRIIIRKLDGAYRIFGTPWPGEAGNALNKSYPLRGIFFIRQSNFNKKVKISRAKALENLLSVASIPWYDQESVSEMLRFCDEMLSSVPACELHCRQDIGIEDVLD